MSSQKVHIQTFRKFLIQFKDWSLPIGDFATYVLTDPGWKGYTAQSLSDYIAGGPDSSSSDMRHLFVSAYQAYKLLVPEVEPDYQLDAEMGFTD